MALDERSHRFAAHLDALAAALRASGVDDESASRVLASASTAVLQAVTLEVLCAPPAPPTAAGPAPAVPAEPPVPLAA